MQAYFDKCEEKLGFVPNVLRAYAFDNAKLQAFILTGRRPDAGRQRPVQARARDDRRGRQRGQPLPLLPDGARRRRAPARARTPSSASSWRRTTAPPTCPPRQKAMLDFAVKLTRGARQDRGGRPRGAARARAAATATSGTSPPSPASTTCRTAWPPPPTCGPTGSTTTWHATESSRTSGPRRRQADRLT